MLAVRVWIVLVILAPSCLMSCDRASVDRPAGVQTPTAVPLTPGCRTHPPGVYPAALPPLPLPEGAEIVDSGGVAREGFSRVEILVPGSHLEVFEHFLVTLDEQGSQVVAQETDPHDAEIFFSVDGRVGLILLGIDCDGTFATIEVENEV